MRAETIEELLMKLKPKKSRREPFPRVKCPHCKYVWVPERTKEPKWCPKCHLNIKTENPRKPTAPKITILVDNRFTPGIMKRLCQFGMYRYRGIPKELPEMTFARGRQRMLSLKLADRFMRSEMTGKQIAGKIGVSRQAFYDRIDRGFQLMVERGSFQLTPKGREQISRERMLSDNRKTPS